MSEQVRGWTRRLLGNAAIRCGKRRGRGAPWAKGALRLESAFSYSQIFLAA